jgi:hypothetical protein
MMANDAGIFGGFDGFGVSIGKPVKKLLFITDVGVLKEVVDVWQCRNGVALVVFANGCFDGAVVFVLTFIFGVGDQIIDLVVFLNWGKICLLAMRDRGELSRFVAFFRPDVPIWTV